MLWHVVDEDGRNWDFLLPYILFLCLGDASGLNWLHSIQALIWEETPGFA